MSEVISNAQSLIDFIAAAPSSYHAAHEGARMLAAEGFNRQDEQEPWDASPGGHYLIRGGALLAWFVPEGAGAHSGFKIVGSHTDSPALAVKPNPDFTNAGWQQVAVEIYGGPLLHTWFDRELTVAGQVVCKDGTTHLVNTGPVLRLPSLAIHLYREDAFKPARQQHMQPILAVNDADTSLMEIIAQQLGINPEDIAAHNLLTADATRGAICGGGEQFIAAGRQDNLGSVHASLVALRDAAKFYTGADVLIMAAFDHEEIGSTSRYGARGPILEDVLTRTGRALGANEEERHQMLARSTCISADAAHSVHPNYVTKHDPTHQPLMGQGLAIKVNANQHYASEASTIALWQNACQRAGVPTQMFVGHNDVPCGTTIGPITATRLGIATVDAGVPMLSMHSTREMVSAQDQLWLSQAIREYWLG